MNIVDGKKNLQKITRKHQKRSSKQENISTIIPSRIDVS